MMNRAVSAQGRQAQGRDARPVQLGSLRYKDGEHSAPPVSGGRLSGSGGGAAGGVAAEPGARVRLGSVRS